MPTDRAAWSDGVLNGLTKKIMEAALDAERTDHLGYERGDPAGRGSGNSRNDTLPKRVLTDAGDVDLDIPRDRNATFNPKLVSKGERRLSQFNELICGLIAKGMSVRDVQDHMAEIYGVDISPSWYPRSPTRYCPSCAPGRRVPSMPCIQSSPAVHDISRHHSRWRESCVATVLSAVDLLDLLEEEGLEQEGGTCQMLIAAKG